MRAASHCANHPSREARVRCTSCEKWICERCAKERRDRVFCSTRCRFESLVRSAIAAVRRVAIAAIEPAWAIAVVSAACVLLVVAVARLLVELAEVWTPRIEGVVEVAVPVPPAAAGGRVTLAGGVPRLEIEGEPGSEILVITDGRPPTIILLNEHGTAVVDPFDVQPGTREIRLRAVGSEDTTVAIPALPTATPTRSSASDPDPGSHSHRDSDRARKPDGGRDRQPGPHPDPHRDPSPAADSAANHDDPSSGTHRGARAAQRRLTAPSAAGPPSGHRRRAANRTDLRRRDVGQRHHRPAGPAAAARFEGHDLRHRRVHPKIPEPRPAGSARRPRGRQPHLFPQTPDQLREEPAPRAAADRFEDMVPVRAQPNRGGIPQRHGTAHGAAVASALRRGERHPARLGDGAGLPSRPLELAPGSLPGLARLGRGRALLPLLRPIETGGSTARFPRTGGRYRPDAPVNQAPCPAVVRAAALRDRNPFPRPTDRVGECPARTFGPLAAVAGASKGAARRGLSGYQVTLWGKGPNGKNRTQPFSRVTR